ncbi:hypothetical protein pipiens_020387 [Culex pipiens pipiens]|uniref:Uncharacterized protein n=1 Tax=Culex pipiens pipiens TaxID=38569 RepID=A0ABD1CG17_CULPP
MRLPRQNRLPAATWMLRRCYLQGDRQPHLTSMAPALNPEQRSQHRNHPPLPPLVEVRQQEQNMKRANPGDTKLEPDCRGRITASRRF